jgi:perosamine synthetase
MGEEEQRAVWDVMKSGQLAQGKKVEEFEQQFAQYVGTKYAIATSNGTTALYLAQLAAGIGSGDEVITSALTFIASATTITFCGAKPVLVDIDPRTFNLDPESIKKQITKRTKAIQPIHLYGQPAAMDEIMEIAEANNLLVIEDACQAHGAQYRGKNIGAIGLAGCYSFYATKNMTSGEGGMITTNDKQLAEKCRILRNQGQVGRYDYKTIGFNYRMTNITAAIGIEQLKKLENFNAKRIQNAANLSDLLDGTVEVPYVLPDSRHVFHQYTILCEDRDALWHALESDGVGCGVYYPIGLHQCEPLKEYVPHSRLPHTENAARKVLSLPIHPSLTPDELRIIATAVKKNVKDS